MTNTKAKAKAKTKKKRQGRRCISISGKTYGRLRRFCEDNHISMSQLVEARVADLLGPAELATESTQTSGPAPEDTTPTAGQATTPSRRAGPSGRSPG